MPRKLLIVACLSLLAFSAFAQRGKKAREKSVPAGIAGNNYKELGAELPPLRYYRRDGVVITDKDLKPDAATVIMLFNPTCEHCEDQARLLQQHLADFRDANLMLMAADKMGPYLSYFVNTTHSDNYPSLQIGLDSSGYINQTFQYQSLPQINIYNKQRKLVRIFSGTTPIDSIKAYMR